MRGGDFLRCLPCAKINLLMVLVSIGQVRRNPEVPRLTRFLCLFILVFSLVLAACSASKMGLYIGVYGLTRLRVLTSLFMICIAVALLCVAVWILVPRFPYMQVTVLTALVVGLLHRLDGRGHPGRPVQRGRLPVRPAGDGGRRAPGRPVRRAVPQLARLLEASDPQVQKETRTTLADIIRQYYHVELENGNVTLEPWDDPALRSWTWTQS